MPVFPGYPLDATVTDETVTDNDHAPRHNSAATAANTLGASLSAVRRIMTRAATTYTTGDQIITPNVTVGNVGGITVSGTTWTLPSTGFYHIFMYLSRSPTLSTSEVGVLNMTIGGALYRFPITPSGSAARRPGYIGLWLAASTTVTFGMQIVPASVTDILFYGSIMKMPSLEP